MESKLHAMVGRRSQTPGRRPLLQSTNPFPRSRIGLMGLGDSDRAQMLDWATECAFLTQSFPLEVEQAVVVLAGLDLMVIDAGREPLLAVAECGRLRLGLPKLPIALVGPHDPKLESAGLRAGAGWYFCLDSATSPPWETLQWALSSTRRNTGAPANQKLCPNVEVDRSARVLYIDGEQRTPTAAKFDLLCYFLDHAGQAVSARELVAQGLLLPTQVARFRCIIHELRHYLGAAGNLVRPVSGYGYRLDIQS
jgi:DNA-binding response OmpR family regulator